MNICKVSGPSHVPSTSISPRISYPCKYRFPEVLPISCSSSQPCQTLRSKPYNRMFIFGVGFVGKFFADQLMNEGWIVSGTCKSVTKKMELEEMGIETFLFNATEPVEFRGGNSLQNASHILISIPPVTNLGDPMLCLHQNLLRSKLHNGNLHWLCYLSSTSVYGDYGGAWVDEDSPVNAKTESAKARIVAEKGWLDLGQDLCVATHVFRLGGVYGPGRSALDTIAKRGPLSEYQRRRESRKYTSRVHVADICQALKASISMSSSGRIFNIVDDDPAPRSEVFSFAGTLIENKNSGTMQCIHRSSSKGTTAMDDDSTVDKEKDTRGEKRVANKRMKKELRLSLLHPSYRDRQRRFHHLSISSSSSAIP